MYDVYEFSISILPIPCETLQQCLSPEFTPFHAPATKILRQTHHDSCMLFQPLHKDPITPDQPSPTLTCYPHSILIRQIRPHKRRRHPIRWIGIIRPQETTILIFSLFLRFRTLITHGPVFHMLNPVIALPLCFFRSLERGIFGVRGGAGGELSGLRSLLGRV